MVLGTQSSLTGAGTRAAASAQRQLAAPRTRAPWRHIVLPRASAHKITRPAASGKAPNGGDALFSLKALLATGRAADFSRRSTARPSARGRFRTGQEMGLRLAPCALRGSFRSGARINANSCTRRAGNFSSRRKITNKRSSPALPGLKSGARQIGVPLGIAGSESYNRRKASCGQSCPVPRFRPRSKPETKESCPCI